MARSSEWLYGALTILRRRREYLRKRRSEAKTNNERQAISKLLVRTIYGIHKLEDIEKRHAYAEVKQVLG